MKARTVLIATAIVGLISVVSLSAHQGWYGGGMMNMHGSSTRGMHGSGMTGLHLQTIHRSGIGGCGDEVGFFLEKGETLSLTGEQIGSLKTIRSDYQKEAIRTGARIRVLQVDIHDLLSKREAPISTLEAKIQEQGDLRTAQELAYVRALSKARKVLTTDQLERLSSLPDWKTANGLAGCHD